MCHRCCWRYRQYHPARYNILSTPQNVAYLWTGWECRPCEGPLSTSAVTSVLCDNQRKIPLRAGVVRNIFHVSCHLSFRPSMPLQDRDVLDQTSFKPDECKLQSHIGWKTLSTTLQIPNFYTHYLLQWWVVTSAWLALVAQKIVTLCKWALQVLTVDTNIAESWSHDPDDACKLLHSILKPEVPLPTKHPYADCPCNNNFNYDPTMYLHTTRFAIRHKQTICTKHTNNPSLITSTDFKAHVCLRK